MTCAIHLCEIYDVEEEQSKEMFGETPRDFLEFLKKWGRKQPSFPRTN